MQQKIMYTTNKKCLLSLYYVEITVLRKEQQQQKDTIPILKKLII